MCWFPAWVNQWSLCDKSLEQECIPVVCIPPALYHWEVSMTKTSLDRDPPPHRDPPGQTPPRQKPPGQRSPPQQRPPTTTGQRSPTNRQRPPTLDSDPHHRKETPSGQRPRPCGQTNTCENITFANFVCGRYWSKRHLSLLRKTNRVQIIPWNLN